MEKENIILQKAVIADSDTIAVLVNSVYRGENSKKGWTTEAGFLEGIRITPEKVSEIIQDNIGIIIKAVLEGQIIACVHLEYKDKYSLLGMLSVDVGYQDRGIGKILIDECERYTKTVYKFDEIRMKVISRRTELIDYYLRRGYLLTGEREEFGSAGDTFGETKEKLFFVTLSKRL